MLEMRDGSFNAQQSVRCDVFYKKYLASRRPWPGPADDAAAATDTASGMP